MLPGASGIAQLAGMQYDGLVVGDGAGDPAWQPVDPAALRAVLENGRPFIGIGLGHELAALAFGAKLVKMQHGHHGANKPVTAVVQAKQPRVPPSVPRSAPTVSTFLVSQRISMRKPLTRQD